MFEGLKEWLPQDDFTFNLILGESVRIGTAYNTHYWETYYNITNQRTGLVFKEYLFYDENPIGTISAGYQIPIDGFSFKNNWLELYYTINF